MAEESVKGEATNPFNTDSSGAEFFVGRTKELTSLRQWLAAIKSHPQHACVIRALRRGKDFVSPKGAGRAQRISMTLEALHGGE
jgi:hypothetical protein